MYLSKISLDEVKRNYPDFIVLDRTDSYGILDKAEIIPCQGCSYVKTVEFRVPKELPAGKNGIFWPLSFDNNPYGDFFVESATQAVLGFRKRNNKVGIIPGRFRLERRNFIFEMDPFFYPKSEYPNYYLLYTDNKLNRFVNGEKLYTFRLKNIDLLGTLFSMGYLFRKEESPRRDLQTTMREIERSFANYFSLAV